MSKLICYDYTFVICSLLIAIMLIEMIGPVIYYQFKFKSCNENTDPRMNIYYSKDTTAQYLKKKYKVMCSGVVYGRFSNKQEACRWATMHLNCNWYIEEYNQYISLHEQDTFY